MADEKELISKVGVEEAVNSVSNKFYAATNDVLHGDWARMTELGLSLLLPACTALLVILVAYFFAKYVSRVTSTPICKRVDETLGKFIGKLIFNIIIVSAFLVVLSKYGVNVTTFTAVLGAAGFAVGLAFQGTLSNFASGILLLVFRPFKVGDMVVCAGVTGKVNEIDLFTTTLDTPDNRRIIVPNSSISGNIIENVTHHAHRRIEVGVGVAYECSLDATRNALTAAVESIRPMLVDGPDRGYQIILNTLSPSSVDWTVRFWGLPRNSEPSAKHLLRPSSSSSI